MNNTTEIPDLIEEVWQLSSAERIVITVVYGSIVVIGVIGNIVVLLSICLVKTMQTTVNLCLAVLALADLVVLIFLPILPFISLFRLDAIHLGQNVCMFLTSYDRGAIVCSVLIFMFVSLDRYIALCHPLKSLKQWSGRRVGWVLGIIWLTAAATSIPYGYIGRYKTFPINNGTSTRTYCYLNYDQQWMKLYETVLNCVIFLLPVPILCFMYGRMVFVLRKQIPVGDAQGTGATSTRKSRSQVIKMLVSIVVIFVVCNLPFRIYMFMYFYAYDVLYSLPYRNHFVYNWIARIVTFANNAANPLVYFLVSSNFREAFLQVFCKCNCLSGKETADTDRTIKTQSSTF